MSNLLERLSSNEVILADGAMGTMLHSRGVSFDKCFDELDLTDPQAVADIHREYIEAGAQLILTNTFGANRFKLGKHGLDKQTREINKAGPSCRRQTSTGVRTISPAFTSFLQCSPIIISAKVLPIVSIVYWSKYPSFFALI